MSINEMSQIVETIQNQANKIKNHFPASNINQIQESGDFSNILLKGINEINSLQKESQHLSQQHLLGSSETELNDVMISQQKAAIALNFGIQVRNKLVGAYQEIMNLSV